MSFVPLNPRPMLQQLINQPVAIRLKWGGTYRGRLISVDSYMNVQLAEATEQIDDAKPPTNLGMVLIRCNNVLWIARGEEGAGDGKGPGAGANGVARDDEEMS